jgi:hypothetical protein
MLARLGENESARTYLQKGIEVALHVGDRHAAGEMTDFLNTL